MLNPRLYRAALTPILIAVILVAFSLQDLPSGATTALAPDAFSAQTAMQDLVGTDSLAERYPVRDPGTPADDALAASIAARLDADGPYSVRTISSDVETVDGPRTVRTVIATRVVGLGAQIVVSADRQSQGRGSAAQLSGTAVMLELARVLSQGTLHRSITFVSTSGDGAGAAAAVKALSRPIDAVLVLGDLGTAPARRPLMGILSDGGGVAPPALQRTLSGAVKQETGLDVGRPGLGTQIARLAFGLAPGDAGAYGRAGLPAVSLSTTGERSPETRATVSTSRVNGFGRALLRTVTALDTGRTVAARPQRTLITARKSIPGWAIRLLSGALLVAPLLCAVDGFARLRRRQAPIGGGLAWVLAATVPLVLACLVMRLLGLAGVLHGAPHAPVPPGAIPLNGAARLALISVGLAVALGALGAHALLSARKSTGLRGPGAAGGVLLALSAVALATWLVNPFAALVLVPAMHLWLPIYAPGVVMRRRAALALVVLGLVPFVAVLLGDARSLGLGTDDLPWQGLLLVAGGHAGVGTWVLWSVFAGCVIATIVLALRRAPIPGGGTATTPAAPLGPRGVLTYAGRPGSAPGAGMRGGAGSPLRR